MAAFAKLELLCPLAWEDKLLDWLLERAIRELVVSYVETPVDGCEPLAMIEQVTGRRRWVRLERLATEDDIAELVRQLGVDFPASGIRYSVADVREVDIL